MRLILALLFCVLLTVLAKRERKKEKERNRGLKTGFYSIYFFFDFPVFSFSLLGLVWFGFLALVVAKYRERSVKYEHL